MTTTEQLQLLELDEKEREDLKAIEEEEVEAIEEIKEEAQAEDDINNIKVFAKLLKQRVKQDFDAVVAVTGEEGVGKSSCAVQIAKRVDRKFSFERNEIILPNIHLLKEKIMQLPDGSAVVVDEAIKLLYKLQWSSKSQIFLNTLYALARKKRKVTLLCISRFTDLNEFFRNHRVKFWVFIPYRGFAVVFIRDWSPFAKDPWWIDHNQKIIESYMKLKKLKDISKHHKEEILQKCRNFLMTFTYDNLSDEEKKQYAEVVEKYKFETLELAEKAEFEFTKREMTQILKDRERLRNILVFLRDRGVPLKKLCEVAHISASTLRSILKTEHPTFQQVIDELKDEEVLGEVQSNTESSV